MKKIIATFSALALLCTPLSQLSADTCVSDCDYGNAYDNSCRVSYCTPQVIIGAVLLAGVIAAIVVNDHSNNHSHNNH